VTTVEAPDVVPSSWTNNGADAEEERSTKCSCEPKGIKESRIGDVLMRARVDRVDGE